MKNKSRAFGVCLWAALLFVSAPEGAAQRPASPSIESTAWAATDALGSTYLFEFGPAGRFTSTSSAGVKSEGAWRQAGDTVFVEVNRKFGQYRGKFAGRKMEGRVRSRSGSELRWTALRQEATPDRSAAVFPIYPPIAMAARAEGVVAVEVQVDGDGAVTSASATGGHPLLQQTSVNAARLWKFAPGGKAGEARAVRLHFSFRIVPRDCSQSGRAPDPAPILLSAYQAEIARVMLCLQQVISHE